MQGGGLQEATSARPCWTFHSGHSGLVTRPEPNVRSRPSRLGSGPSPNHPQQTSEQLPTALERTSAFELRLNAWNDRLGRETAVPGRTCLFAASNGNKQTFVHRIANGIYVSPQVQLLKVFLAILVWQRNSIMSRRLGTPQFDTTDLARNGLRQLGEGNPANSLVRCQTRANVTKDRQRRVAIRLVPRGNGDKRPSALQAASDQGWVQRRPRQLPRARIGTLSSSNGLMR